MNRKLLEDKILDLREQPQLNPQVVDFMAGTIAETTDWRLYKINPLLFADEHGFKRSEILDFFVYASRNGLFDFSWSMICPTCGEIQNDDGSINDLSGNHFHCHICHLDVNLNMDDFVEVTFTVNPEVRELNLDPFSSAAAYRQYYFSDSYKRSQQVIDYIDSITLAFEKIPAGKSIEVKLQLEPGRQYRVVSAGLHSQYIFKTAEDALSTEKQYEVGITEEGFRTEKDILESTSPVLVFRNRRESDFGIIIVEADFNTLHSLIEKHPPRRDDFLTGKMLLNHQSFRDLFRIQSLSARLRLNIRSLTILFTDLKGSTELYDRTGDAEAYSLIQEHFSILTAIVKKHDGAVIKTMGDAIMATFSHPYEAVAAAVDMIRDIEKVREGNSPLGLKIGIHEGPALAINNAGQVDYFGQTVNISARVQGLADAGTIYTTENVTYSRDVSEKLKEAGFQGYDHSVSLKGVGEKTRVKEWRSV